MTRRGVILYGPPAAGKDTVTHALTELDPKYQHFHRLKAGPGRTTSYRLTTPDEIDRLRDAGEVIWENERYQAVYVVDRPELQRMLDEGTVPVVHLGQTEAVRAMAKLSDAEWLTVYLWCPRPVAVARIKERSTGDSTARLTAWDDTEPLHDAALTIDTSTATPGAIARRINDAMPML